MTNSYYPNHQLIGCYLVIYYSIPMTSKHFEVSSALHGGSLISNRYYQLHGNNHNDICKLDGSNFALRKNQMHNALIQRKQLRPLGKESQRPKGMVMNHDDWEELDLMAMPIVKNQVINYGLNT